jgi:hypothetical protein
MRRVEWPIVEKNTRPGWLKKSLLAPIAVGCWEGNPRLQQCKSGGQDKAADIPLKKTVWGKNNRNCVLKRNHGEEV